MVQIRARLQQEVADGAFYEAQQTYKSTFVRLKSKGDTANAISIIQARRLLMAAAPAIKLALHIAALHDALWLPHAHPLYCLQRMQSRASVNHAAHMTWCAASSAPSGAVSSCITRRPAGAMHLSCFPAVPQAVLAQQLGIRCRMAFSSS